MLLIYDCCLGLSQLELIHTSYPLAFTNHTFGELRPVADVKHLNRRYIFEMAYWDTEDIRYDVADDEEERVDDYVMLRREHRALFSPVEVNVYRY